MAVGLLSAWPQRRIREDKKNSCEQRTLEQTKLVMIDLSFLIGV